MSVHPRVCGERAPNAPSETYADGSSPRVRGTAGDHPRTPDPSRFIPACAGNGSTADKSSLASAVHPRVCGERAITVQVGAIIAGSSPRVRGTVWTRKPPTSDLRFIPACAGNGVCRLFCRRRHAVHPRVCGERRYGIIFNNTPTGSSPRVRGTGLGRVSSRYHSRFIPACAGNGDMANHVPHELAVHPRVCGERSLPFRSLTSRNGSSPRVRGTGEACYA